MCGTDGLLERTAAGILRRLLVSPRDSALLVAFVAPLDVFFLVGMTGGVDVAFAATGFALCHVLHIYFRDTGGIEPPPFRVTMCVLVLTKWVLSQQRLALHLSAKCQRLTPILNTCCRLNYCQSIATWVSPHFIILSPELEAD